MPDRSDILVAVPATVQPCASCGLQYRTLFPAVLNRRGWVDLCGGCIEPAHGEPRAYTGRYPIITPLKRPTPPALRLVTGAANR